MTLGQILSSLLLFALLIGCFGADEVPTEAQVKKMKVKELRKFLDDRGVDCQGCVEKTDFVAKAVKAVKEGVKILDSKKPRVVNKDPIAKQWKPVVLEVCQAETDKEDFCKQLYSIVDGFFFEYMRKFKRDLSVTEPHAAEISFKHPYAPVFRTILKEMAQFMVKEDTKKAGKIRPKFEARAKPWFRDVCLENPNPMFEELGETGGPTGKGKKGKKRDEL